MGGVYWEGYDRLAKTKWVCCGSFDDLTCMPGVWCSLSILFAATGLRPQNSDCPATTPRPFPTHHFSPTYTTDTIHTRTRDSTNKGPTLAPDCSHRAVTRLEQRRRAAHSGVSYSHDSQSEPANVSMEPRRRPEYNLDIFADLACVKDVVKGASKYTVFMSNPNIPPHYALPSVRFTTWRHS
jgi:hypothetical protein